MNINAFHDVFPLCLPDHAFFSSGGNNGQGGVQMWSVVERQAFLAKCEMLDGIGERVHPGNFVQMVFSNRSRLVVVLGPENGSHRGTVTRVNTADLWNFAPKANVFVPYCTFRNDFYAKASTETVRAFVVDLDGVSPDKLDAVMSFIENPGVAPRPSHVVNSGTGLHVVYMLKDPLPYQENRYAIGAVNRALQNAFRSTGCVDPHPVIQPYRFPGFATKVGFPAVAYEMGERLSFEQLVDLLSVPTSPPEETDEMSRTETNVQMGCMGKFYRHFVGQLLLRLPQPGKRNRSFFVLGVVAFKCREEISREDAMRDVSGIYKRMKNAGMVEDFDLPEAIEAWKNGYNRKYIKMSWRTICEQLGWDPRTKLHDLVKESPVPLCREALKVRHMIRAGRTMQEIADALGMSVSALYSRHGKLIRRLRSQGLGGWRSRRRTGSENTAVEGAKA